MDDLEEVQQSSGTTESGGPAQYVNSVPSESSTMQSMFLQFLNEFEQRREDEERRKEQRREDEEHRKEQHWEEHVQYEREERERLSRESSQAADHQVVQQSVQHHPSLDKHGMTRT